MEIPLRRKYLTAMRGRYRSAHNDGKRYNRTKAGAAAHTKKYGIQPKKTMLVDGGTGHAVMVYSSDLE